MWHKSGTFASHKYERLKCILQRKVKANKHTIYHPTLSFSLLNVYSCISTLRAHEISLFNNLGDIILYGVLMHTIKCKFKHTWWRIPYPPCALLKGRYEFQDNHTVFCRTQVATATELIHIIERNKNLSSIFFFYAYPGLPGCGFLHLNGNGYYCLVCFQGRLGFVKLLTSGGLRVFSWQPCACIAMKVWITG